MKKVYMLYCEYDKIMDKLEKSNYIIKYIPTLGEIETLFANQNEKTVMTYLAYMVDNASPDTFEGKDRLEELRTFVNKHLVLCNDNKEKEELEQAENV